MSSQEAASVTDRAAAKTDRVAASLTLMGVVAVSVLAALSLPALSTGTAATTPTAATATKQMPAVPVRVIIAPRATKEGCAGQTWPYIEARCLTRAENNAAPLANASASPVAPSASAPQAVPPAPQIAAAEPPAPGRSQTVPSDPKPTVRDAANTSVVVTPDPRVDGPSLARLAPPMPTPPGAEPRLPGAVPASAPPSTDAARTAAIAGTAAAGLALTTVEEPKVGPRAERRRREIHSSRRFGLFGFRIFGGRF
jgi:hypothetical protein